MPSSLEGMLSPGSACGGDRAYLMLLQAPPHSKRRLSIRPQVLVLAAFTPYLGTVLSVRVEHIIVYGLLVALLLDFPGAERALFLSRRLIALWLSAGGLILVNTLTALTARARFLDLETLQLTLRLSDSFLLQAAAMLVVLASMSRRVEDSRRQIRIAATTFVALMCANSIVILIFDPAGIETVLRQFWTNPAGTPVRGWTSAAARELTAGRYGGIFNQPFDGGLAYSLALVSWWYISREKFGRASSSALLPLFGLGLLFAGGMSTGSKVFFASLALVGGLILLVDGSDRGHRLSRNLRFLAGGSAGVAAVIALGFAELTGLQRFLDSLTSDTSAATAGRFSSLNDWWNQILDDFSLIGSGSFYTYTDNALQAYLIGGGLLGVLLIGLVYREFFRVGRQLPQNSAERWFASSLTLITLAASFGSVSLKTIRASSVFWVLMALLLGHAANVKRSQGRTGRHSPRSTHSRGSETRLLLRSESSGRRAS